MDSKKNKCCVQQGRSFRSHLQFFFFAFLEWEMSVWCAEKRLCRSQASELFLYLYENSIPLDRWAGLARSLARGALDVNERRSFEPPWLETDPGALRRHCSRLAESREDAWVLSFAEWHLEIALRDLWPEKRDLPRAHLFLYDTWQTHVFHAARSINPFKWHHFWLRFLLVRAESSESLISSFPDLKLGSQYEHEHFAYRNTRACKLFMQALVPKRKPCWLSHGSFLVRQLFLQKF